MLQRAKQRLGVIAQPQGSALPPKPSVGPGSASRAPELGADPSIVPCCFALSLGPLLEMGN